MKFFILLLCGLAIQAQRQFQQFQPPRAQPQPQAVRPPPTQVCQCRTFDACVTRADQVMQRCMYESCTGQLNAQNRAFVQCGQATHAEQAQWQACLSDITGKPCTSNRVKRQLHGNSSHMPYFMQHLYAARRHKRQTQGEEEEGNWFTDLLGMLGIDVKQWQAYGTCVAQCMEASSQAQGQSEAVIYLGNPDSYNKCAAQLNCRPVATNWANYAAASKICGERMGDKWKNHFIKQCKCYEDAAKSMSPSSQQQGRFFQPQTGNGEESSSMCDMLINMVDGSDSDEDNSSAFNDNYG